jgi:hypothetical protein
MKPPYPRHAVALSLAAVIALPLAACGGIQSSPQADAYNAALDRCQGVDTPSVRQACFRDVQGRYSPP